MDEWEKVTEVRFYNYDDQAMCRYPDVKITIEMNGHGEIQHLGLSYMLEILEEAKTQLIVRHTVEKDSEIGGIK